MSSHILIVSASPSATSRSRAMALQCEHRLVQEGHAVKVADIAGTDPDCFPDALRADFRQASHVVFAVPIYVYDVPAAVSRLVESLTEQELGDKVVGFLCAAGGHRSYMSIMPFANALMLNFRCWVVPRFVYATPEDFNGQQPLAAIEERLGWFCRDLLSMQRRPLPAQAHVIPAEPGTGAVRAQARRERGERVQAVEEARA